MSEEVKQEGTFKIKKSKVLKPKQLAQEDKPIKIDLSKPKTEEQDAIQVGETKKVDVGEQTAPSSGVDKQVPESKEISENEKDPIIQEIIEEPVEEKKEEEVVEIGEKMEPQQIRQEDLIPEKPAEQLPENIQKVIEFMQETGGTLDDYVRLNADYSSVDNDSLLREYYKNTKSHLDQEEIDFLIEDNFSFDEDVDEERVVRKTKLAYKEEVAKAKQHLEGLKSKYYDEIKLRPGVTQDQQKAVDFFNRYKKEEDIASQQHEKFKSYTKEYFSDEFKGFDFKVGDKKFRYGIKNVNDVADKQSDISNTIEKFLDKDGNVADVKGYHKALYAADHADTIASHFYEQGKADAVRDLAAKAKNVSNEPRATAPEDVYVGGLKVKAISGLDSSKLRIKTRKFN
jgi:hypothetical protein|tara:strand:- start:184 stop:1380 length:1197 start_codon:yes stop_codon:yes gene_type:complete